jgi:deoxyribose-phosphate aldolase
MKRFPVRWRDEEERDAQIRYFAQKCRDAEYWAKLILDNPRISDEARAEAANVCRLVEGNRMRLSTLANDAIRGSA